MKRQGHRKQILLFLLTVLLPSLVLVALTLRIVTQERELAQKRIADEQQRIAREIGQSLLARLEKIRLQEAAALANDPRHISGRHYLNAEVVLLAEVLDNRLILPWDAARRELGKRRPSTVPQLVRSSEWRPRKEKRRGA